MDLHIRNNLFPPLFTIINNINGYLNILYDLKSLIPNSGTGTHNCDIQKLDNQVSICSLIPPATAISKTQDRADTSVWWKLPFSMFFIIYYVQSAIINKECKSEKWFLCSAHPIIVLYICMKFHENISNNFLRYRADTCVWWKWPFSIFKGQ